MKVSKEGVEFIKRREGVRHKPYRDVGGFLTVGVGHLLTGTVIREYYSDAEIDAFLEDDLAHVECALERLVKVPLTQTYFDALASFVFNIGVDAFKRSTLLKLLNVGKYMQAADEFIKWRRSGGKVVKGLESRREMERKLFLEGVYE